MLKPDKQKTKIKSPRASVHRGCSGRPLPRLRGSATLRGSLRFRFSQAPNDSNFLLLSASTQSQRPSRCCRKPQVSCFDWDGLGP